MGPEGDMEIGCALCDRCVRHDKEDRILYDLAHLEDKTLKGLINESRFTMKDLHEKAREFACERKERARGQAQANREDLKDMKERFSYRLLQDLLAGKDLEKLMEEYLEDEGRRQLEDGLATTDNPDHGIDEEDMRNALRDYVESDLVEIDGTGVKITPKGSRQLARYVLRRIWENLSGPSTGTNRTRDEGFGVTQTTGTRKYEYGNEFFASVWKVHCWLPLKGNPHGTA